MIKTSIFGGGCFWCTEAIFKKINGVVSISPGYIGGHVLNPTYEQ
ncbi:peptide-methionine (S)-S-oxide reductase, partial [Flavobacteriaceae bacterium]|nr:peptide-methionine (S)-S-oxide reductase [Flavobacteriaceae bacterium]